MKILCYDVGGSSTKYAILDENAQFYDRGSVPSETASMEDFLASVKEIYDRYDNEICGVSFSMPGVIDPVTGYFHTGGAYDRFIHDINMKDVFHTIIDKPVLITNDAKCAAYGELGYGCLKDVNDAVVIVLGTGIGGCLIKDREVIYGKHLLSGEFSYINTAGTTDFNDSFAFRCGTQGLIKRTREVFETEENFTGRQIFDLVNKGEEKAKEALHMFCMDLAIQIYNLQVIFDPEVFAIGGGISAQPVLFEVLDDCFREIERSHGDFFLGKPDVRVCTYGNDANLIGALYRFVKENKE